MSAALSFERRRSFNFLVLTCIRKLAGFCLALDLAVTVRWIPSEINVSDRLGRIHDPSDIRDKTMTNLLTAGETEKSEAVAVRGRPGRKQSESFTDIASGEATDEKSENTCRRRECRRLEREGQRWDVVNRWRGGDEEEAKTFGTVSPWTGQNDFESWRGNLSFLE